MSSCRKQADADRCHPAPVSAPDSGAWAQATGAAQERRELGEAAAGGLDLEVLHAFQQTMQQFLGMQARIMQQYLHPAMPRVAATVQTPMSSPLHPQALVRHAPTANADGGFSLRHRLTLDSDPYLADHVIDGRPVLPMAVALEYIAQFAASCWPRRRVVELRDVQLMAGVTIDADREVWIELRAGTPAAADDGLLAGVIELWSCGERPRRHYRATALLADADLAPPAPRLSAPAGTPMPGAQAYTTLLFHGPRFQRVERIAALGESGALALLQASTPAQMLDRDTPADAGWLFDPAALDVAPQLAWIWGFTQRGAAALPTAMPSVRRYGPPTGTERLWLVQRIACAAGSTALRYDAEYVDSAGGVRYAISAGESTLSPALNRLVPASAAFARRAPDDRRP